MKKILVLLALVGLSATTQAQLLKKIKNEVKDRAEKNVVRKAGDATDKAIDKAVEDASGNKNGSGKGEAGGNANNEDGGTKSKTKNSGIKSYSKYDFVPGEKILYAEDFSQDVIGEFPLKWNTNGTGEVVTLEGLQGKWLKMTADTKYEAPYAKKLPANYTIEFDLVLDFKESMRVPDMEFLVFGKGRLASYPPGIRFYIGPQAGTFSSGEEQNTIDRFRFVSVKEDGNNHLQSKDQLAGELYNHKSEPVHVAMWVQGERVRIWVNQQKIYDLPRGLAPGLELTSIGMQTGQYGADESNYQYYLSNLKIAEAMPDTRSKLITEGRWSTTGILFDVNSDRIRPESYGVLKEIAATLKENTEVKVKIIGHTDSDGDDAKNMDLSKRRAAAVRALLASEFGIDGSRLLTDGAGETKPVADNNSKEGKAQNRRVEFIKL